MSLCLKQIKCGSKVLRNLWKTIARLYLALKMRKIKIDFGVLYQVYEALNFPISYLLVVVVGQSLNRSPLLECLSRINGNRSKDFHMFPECFSWIISSADSWSIAWFFFLVQILFRYGESLRFVMIRWHDGLWTINGLSCENDFETSEASLAVKLGQLSSA